MQPGLSVCASVLQGPLGGSLLKNCIWTNGMMGETVMKPSALHVCSSRMSTQRYSTLLPICCSRSGRAEGSRR